MTQRRSSSGFAAPITPVSSNIDYLDRFTGRGAARFGATRVRTKTGTRYSKRQGRQRFPDWKISSNVRAAAANAVTSAGSNAPGESVVMRRTT